MAGIGIEIGLQELGSKFCYRNRDRNWLTGIGFEVELQELRSKMVAGIGIEVRLGTGIEVGLQESIRRLRWSGGGGVVGDPHVLR